MAQRATAVTVVLPRPACVHAGVLHPACSGCQNCNECCRCRAARPAPRACTQVSSTPLALAARTATNAAAVLLPSLLACVHADILRPASPGYLNCDACCCCLAAHPMCVLARRCRAYRWPSCMTGRPASRATRPRSRAASPTIRQTLRGACRPPGVQRRMYLCGVCLDNGPWPWRLRAVRCVSGQ
eukprot:64866-Chlamydomonas_euryale.AAC.1